MLKALIQTRLLALWNSMFTRLRRGKTVNGRAMIVGAVLLFGLLMVSIGSMLMPLAMTLPQFGLGWLHFAVAGLLALALCFVGSIFVTKEQLFNAKDNELLLSMPVPPRYILISRLLMLLLLNYLYSTMVLLPAMVIYCIFAPVTVPLVLAFLLAALLLPLMSMALSCLCGWLLAVITARMRRTNLISTVLLMGFFLGYFYVVSNLSNYMTRLMENGTEIAAAFQRALPPLYYFGSGIMGDWLNLLLFALICLVPFVLVCLLLSRSFHYIVTGKRGSVRIQYREKTLKAASPRVALLKKECSRFFGTTMYMFNSGIGAVMEIVFAVVLVVQGEEMLSQLLQVPMMWSLLPVMICAVGCFCAVMTNTTAPSISLEGKSFALLRSLPVSAADVFWAKAGVNLLIGVPPIIVLGIAAAVVLPLTPLQMAAVLLLPLTVQVFSAQLGLITNLHMPRFDWINETAVIKQSGSTFMAMLGGMAALLVPVILYAVWLHKWLQPDLYLLLCAAFFALVSVGEYAYLMTRGKVLFEQL